MSRPIVLWTILAVACNVVPAPGPAAKDQPPAPAPSAPHGPPCIHEACAERPRFLQCTDKMSGFREVSCARFEIIYERHCDCDRWAP